jgi:hypothetical protein
VGADVRKYFKDQWRVLKIGFEGFKTLISQYYNDDEQGYPLTAIALLAWIMLVMLVCDFPTALVKGILGLPFRLARGLVNLICDDGSPSWKDSMDLVNKLETMLLFALFFVARIPLALLTFFGGLFVAGPILSMAVGAVTGFAKLFVKPFIECFRPNVDEPAVIVTLDAQAADAEPAPAPSSSQQLMRQLMRAKLKLGEQNDQLIIGDHVLSKREIEIDLGLLRQNKPVRNLDWLLEVKDFSVASSVRLFSLPDLHLPTRSPVGQPALVDDVVVPASIAPN